MSDIAYDLEIRERNSKELVAWQALTDEDMAHFCLHSPAELYKTLKEAEEGRDWTLIRVIIEDME